MKLLKLTLILSVSVLLAGCREKAISVNVKGEIDSIVSKWIPVAEEGIGSFSLIPATGKNYVLKGETNIPGAKDEVVNYLKNAGVAFTDSVVLLPDPTKVDKPWGIVTLSVCNMRGAASHSAELVTQAIMGTPVEILKKEDGWLLIQTPDSYIGWTNDDAIAELSGDELNEWKNSNRIICTTNYGNITDKDGGVVSDLVYGAILVKTGEKSREYEIVLPDGRKGFIRKDISKDFVTWAKHGDPVPSEMISFARTLLGTPYLWGGTSTKGVDCSGFVKTIYFTNGVILTRDASSQYMYGTEVPLETGWKGMTPGDLLFFGSMRDGKKRITHVGMYIGDSEVIHSSGMVKINSLDPQRQNYSKHLDNTLLGAKRFIGAPSGKGNMQVLNHNWYF